MLSRRALRAPATCVVAAATLVGAAACGRSDATSGGAASASASAGAAAPSASATPVPIINALPQKSDEVRAVMNPNNEKPYSGPTGSVRGVITIKGDQAPMLADVTAKIPDSCKPARFVYGRLFREGMMRSLADALVTVTEYKGYVPAKSVSVKVVAKDCAWPTRTIGLTYGQRLDVQSGDRESYVPRLLGADMRAEMVAVPGHDPVHLYPQAPGRYTLVDSMRIYSTAEVLVLKYPTFAVTGLDGKYEIQDVPVGEVTVSALLPAIMQTAQTKNVKVEAGKASEVNLEINFDQKTMAPAKPDDKAAKKKPVIH